MEDLPLGITAALVTEFAVKDLPMNDDDIKFKKVIEMCAILNFFIQR